MHKLVITAAVIASALLLTGCGAAQQTDEAAGEARFAAAADETETTSEPTPTETPEPTEDLTAAGAVCDPQSGNDFPCLVADPDLAVVNMTMAGRSVEPLASMPAEERIALAHQACDVLEAGGTSETDILVETIPNSSAESATLNNFSVFSAGSAAYCPAYADQWVQDALASAAAG